MAAESRHSNPDLEPTPASGRTWSYWHIAALWVGMAVCIPTYQLASSLISAGMNWWQAVGTVALGNVIVLIPLALNAHPGTKYGIPFPVLLRSSFGIFGSNIPALMRGIVACGWFGIQTWIGGQAIYVLGTVLWGWTAQPGPETYIPIIQISPLELACFLIFWAIQLAIIWAGMDSVKWLEVLSAPFLLVMGLLLLGWAVVAAKGWGPIFTNPGTLDTPGKFFAAFAPGLTAQVAFWATLSLNIPDFSRFAKSQKDQLLGQAIGLPPTMTLFAFIGVAVTSTTVILYGTAIWDPVQLISKIGSPWAVVVAMAAIGIATLSTNLAANVVSPANDFANLAPKLISFRLGSIITAAIGVLMCPWLWMRDPSGYVFTWLIGYSALLGPIGGIMIADYFVCRKRELDVDSLYQLGGNTPRFFAPGILALLLGILPNLPGFLMRVTRLKFPEYFSFFARIYDFAWFTGFGTAFLVYWLFYSLMFKPSRP